MKTKIKVISLITSFIIAIGVSFAFPAENAKANSEACDTYQEYWNDCWGEASNCGCPIIVTPAE